MREKPILLVNPYICDFAAYDLWLYPLGLDFLAYLLRGQGFGVVCLDVLRTGRQHWRYYQPQAGGRGKFYRRPIAAPAALHMVRNRHFALYGQPEAVVLRRLKPWPEVSLILITSLMSYWYPGVLHTIGLLRRAYPTTPILIGGMWPLQYPDHARRIVSAMANVDVETDLSFARLRELLADRLGGSLPQGDVFSWFLRYSLQGPPACVNFLPVITSLGCPYSCRFCLTPIMYGNNFIRRDTDKVITDILTRCSMDKQTNITFFDDALLVDKDRRFKPLLRALIASGKPLACHLPNGLHVALLDGETVGLMKQAGFQTIRLSAEGFDAATMALSGNKVKQDDLELALELFAAHGVAKHNLGIYVLFGLPGQDFAAQRELALSLTHRGYKVGLSELSPIPGTPVFRQLCRQYPELAREPLYSNNSLFINLFTNQGEKFYTLKKELRAIRSKTKRGAQYGYQIPQA